MCTKFCFLKLLSAAFSTWIEQLLVFWKYNNENSKKKMKLTHLQNYKDT